MEPLKIFYSQENEIEPRSIIGRANRHRPPNWRITLQCAKGEIASKDLRATGLFPCDKNIFKPHDFPPAPEDTEAAPVNHPALAKNSNQPSFSSSNFSPFTSAEVLLASDISAVPSLNLQPNPRGKIVKKIKSSSYRNFVGATQKKKIKKATKSKTTRLAVECCSWFFKKTEESGLPGSNSVWHSIRFGHWPNCSFSWRFDRRRGTRRWLWILYWSVLSRPQV